MGGEGGRKRIKYETRFECHNPKLVYMNFKKYVKGLSRGRDGGKQFFYYL